MKNISVLSIALLLCLTVNASDKYKLVKGEVVEADTKLTSTKGNVTEFSVSPDNSHLIFMQSNKSSKKRPVSMWVMDLKTKKTSQVGSLGPNDPGCCRFSSMENSRKMFGAAEKLQTLQNGVWAKDGTVVTLQAKGGGTIDCLLSPDTVALTCDP
jgi:hypothetical protein